MTSFNYTKVPTRLKGLRYNKVEGCLRKGQLGFGFGLCIRPKPETQWILTNLVVCKDELPPKTREKTDFGLAQFVLSKHNCCWPTRPEIIPTHCDWYYSRLQYTRTSSYRIAAALIQDSLKKNLNASKPSNQCGIRTLAVRTKTLHGIKGFPNGVT